MFFWMQFFALILLVVHAPPTMILGAVQLDKVSRDCGISLPAERSKGRASLQDWSAPTGGAVGHNAAPTR